MEYTLFGLYLPISVISCVFLPLTLLDQTVVIVFWIGWLCLQYWPANSFLGLLNDTALTPEHMQNEMIMHAELWQMHREINGTKCSWVASFMIQWLLLRVEMDASNLILEGWLLDAVRNILQYLTLFISVNQN